MFWQLRTVAVVLVGGIVAAPAAATSIVDQPGQFKMWLPNDFRILRHGRDHDRAVAGQSAYELKALSAKGNVKVFAQSSYKSDPSIDFMKQFSYMEYELKRERLFKWLRPAGMPKRGSQGAVTQFWRFYHALGQRGKTVQPYSILAFISFDRPLRRLYTMTISAQADVFKQNKLRLKRILSSFRPYAAPARKPAAKGRPIKRISLKGLLRLRKTGLVVAKASASALRRTRPSVRRTTVRPPVRRPVVRRPAVRVAPKKVQSQTSVKASPTRVAQPGRKPVVKGKPAPKGKPILKGKPTANRKAPVKGKPAAKAKPPLKGKPVAKGKSAAKGKPALKGKLGDNAKNARKDRKKEKTKE